MRKVKLSQVCEIIAGQSPPSNSYNQDGNGLPFFQGKADFGQLYPTVRYWCSNPNKISKPNDILFSLRAPVGPTNINNIEACIGRGIAAIRCNQEILLNYLIHYLRGNEEKIAALGTGSTFKAITIGVLKDIQIPLPPLAEQQRIADLLDAADALRQKDKALLEKYEALGQSLFLELFGDPVKNEKGWEVKTLKEVCEKITDGTHDTPKRLDTGIKFITGKHIKPHLIDFENSDYVDELTHIEIYKRCNPEFQDILYTNIGVNFGTAALNTVNYEFSMKNVALLKYSRELLKGYFLEYLLNYVNFKEKMRIDYGIGGAQQFLSLANIKSLKIIVPPLELQNHFASQIELIEQQKAKVKENLAKSEELFKGLLGESFK